MADKEDQLRRQGSDLANYEVYRNDYKRLQST
jgi:hypothetical protein